MSNTQRLLFTGLFALASVLVHASDLTGTWKGSFDFQGQNVPLTFHFKAEGSKVIGDVDGLPAGDTLIKDGKLADSKLTFSVMTDYQGTAYKLNYTGKVSDNEIGFSFGTEGGEFAAEMVARREQAGAAASVTGTWKGAFDFQGQSVPLTVTMKDDAGHVTGSVDGLPAGTAEIKDGKVADKKVTFWLMTEYQGMAIKLVYTGAVEEGQIRFTFGTEDGAFSAEFVAKAGL